MLNSTPNMSCSTFGPLQTPKLICSWVSAPSDSGSAFIAVNPLHPPNMSSSSWVRSPILLGNAVNPQQPSILSFCKLDSAPTDSGSAVSPVQPPRSSS